jgi:hypothetical protein
LHLKHIDEFMSKHSHPLKKLVAVASAVGVILPMSMMLTIDGGKISIEGTNQQGDNGMKVYCISVNVIAVTPKSVVGYGAKPSSSDNTSNSTQFPSVSFTAVTSRYRTDVKSAPSTNTSVIGYISPNTRVDFDGWSYALEWSPRSTLKSYCWLQLMGSLDRGQY